MTMQLSRRSFLAGTTLAGLASAADMSAEAQTPPRSNIAVRVQNEFAAIDPAFRTFPADADVGRVVFQQLMKYKANSTEYENDAAAEVKQVSPTLIEFRLKPGQMFTEDFGEMTAEDVKFSFERFLGQGTGGRQTVYKADWMNLERVETTGQYTGRIVLSRPNAALFALAIADHSGGIVSKKAAEQRGEGFGSNPVGSGPYQLVSVERQKGAVLRRNPGFTGAKPRFDEIAVRYIQDPKTTELALRSGEIDFAVLPPAVAEPLRSVQGLAIDQHPGLAYVWIGMNVEKAPLNDVRVRQAIRLALDADQMLLAGYNGKVQRLNSLIMAPILGVWKDAPVYKRNVAEARRLLQEAGQGGGFRTRITILNQPVFQSMALVARALLQEVGITLDVEPLDGGSFWSSGKGDGGKNLDLSMLRFNGKLDPNFLMQWFTSDQIGVWNWQRWADPSYDKLAGGALAEADPAKRAEIVIKAQQEMDKSAAFYWLTNEVAFVARRSWLKPGLMPGAINWQYEHFDALA
ncbi:peptide/nickel transport system substrate-binding protein [Rhizobiales bacterium GAS188]|nr:peptide/nickel transport system substrate-binding protein [Rhizobiales bacterium GAS188]